MSFAVLLGPLLDQYESPWRAFFVLLNSGVCVRRSPSSPRALGFAFLEPLFWFRGGEGRGRARPARREYDATHPRAAGITCGAYRCPVPRVALHPPTPPRTPPPQVWRPLGAWRLLAAAVGEEFARRRRRRRQRGRRLRRRPRGAARPQIVERRYRHGGRYPRLHDDGGRGHLVRDVRAGADRGGFSGDRRGSRARGLGDAVRS